MPKSAKSNVMEIHYGEDYISGYIGNDSIFTTINQSAARKLVLEKMAHRYNIHDELVRQVEMLERSLCYYMQKDQKDGDAEGAALKGISLDVCRQVLTKARAA